MPIESALAPETETPALPDLSAEPSIEAESPAVWKPTVASEALEEAPETPAPATSSLEPEPAASEPPPEQLETNQKTALESWLDQAAQRLAQPGQNVLTTLEELENDLRTQGFTPLEPGTLSRIAQEPEPTLSSALAQLGNFGPQSTGEDHLTQPTQPEVAPPAPPVESLWPATPAPVSQTAPQPIVNQTQEQTSHAHLDELMSYISSPAANPEGKKEAVPDPTFNFTSAATPEVYPAVSVDSELETTMKRPATRLQPMPQRPAAQAVQQSQAIARGKPGERPASSKAAEGNLSYKERLLKGYQHQLAGTYDDAMQEYRIIIRNAPELLSEVVSNMRALLKLAPKYSAGYRVLGDAYMRQGEYLQAMEAYNKALTMAKKAKS
jgi:tetratricopeptide (TPR) repeat protein